MVGNNQIGGRESYLDKWGRPDCYVDVPMMSLMGKVLNQLTAYSYNLGPDTRHAQYEDFIARLKDSWRQSIQCDAERYIGITELIFMAGLYPLQNSADLAPILAHFRKLRETRVYCPMLRRVMDEAGGLIDARYPGYWVKQAQTLH